MVKKKKRILLTTTQAVARIDSMMPILYRNIQNALRIEATMEAGNSIVQTMPDKRIPGAGAFNTIMQSLAFDLATHLARLYDLGNRSRPVNGRDVASIPLAVRLFRQKRCQVALMQRARVWIPGGSSQADRFESDCARALERLSDSYSAIYKGEFGRGGLKALKVFRDTVIAHSLMTDIELRPIYNHLFRLTDCARDFVEHARLAASGDNLSLEDTEKIYHAEADVFWRMALLGESN